MKKEINIDGKIYVLKEENNYKIGDKFRRKKGCFEGDIYMLIEYGIDKVNFVKLERPSGDGCGVGATVSHYEFKVEDKYNITKEDITNGYGGMFFDYYELIED